VKESKGVLVASVDESGAAAKAGIKAGDVIVGIDNEKVDGVRALLKALSGKTEGTVPSSSFATVLNRRHSNARETRTGNSARPAVASTIEVA
jgi:S1-C subfamily serine protease